MNYDLFTNGNTFNDTYRIMSKIGSGGTGDVYLAYHMRLEKYVVIKKIKENFAGSINVRAEVDILKKLKHSFLPQVYDFLQTGSTVYTVMDYIEGNDLERYIKTGYVVDEQTLIKWLRQLCEVLEYLHSQVPPIIHSDIKPGNIMITNEGNVCLIDFNISFGADDSSQISGISIPYASPEQYEKARLFVNKMEYRGIILDGRSDMYSLAASFYHLMTGVPPSAPNQYTTPLSQFDILYSQGLVNILEKAMSYNVSDRFKDISAMKKAVNSIYRNTRAYRGYIAGVILSSVIYVMAMGFGIWCVVRGMNEIVRERYTKDLKNMMTDFNECIYDEVIDEGIDILNKSDYESVLHNNIGERIEILHIVGECYYENADYEDAMQYYGDAVTLMSDVSKYSAYYRDYVVSLVKCGCIDEVKGVIKNGKEKGISDVDMSIIEAELFIADDRYEDAFEIIDKVINEDISEQEKLHLLITGSEAAQKTKEYEKAIEYLERASDISDNVGVLRKLGNAYMFAVKSGEKSDDNRYMTEALECYKTITQKKYCSFNDMLNLAICYRALEKYSESIKVLNNLAGETDDYRIYMHLAFAYDKKGDSEKAEKNVKKAAKKYELSSKSDRESEGSDNIQAMYELKKKYNN